MCIEPDAVDSEDCGANEAYTKHAADERDACSPRFCFVLIREISNKQKMCAKRRPRASVQNTKTGLRSEEYMKAKLCSSALWFLDKAFHIVLEQISCTNPKVFVAVPRLVLGTANLSNELLGGGIAMLA